MGVFYLMLTQVLDQDVRYTFLSFSSFQVKYRETDVRSSFVELHFYFLVTKMEHFLKVCQDLDTEFKQNST